jgi:hypothetical protein
MTQHLAAMTAVLQQDPEFFIENSLGLFSSKNSTSFSSGNSGSDVLDRYGILYNMVMHASREDITAHLATAVLLLREERNLLNLSTVQTIKKRNCEYH